MQYGSKQSRQAEVVSMRALAVSVAWIIALLGGYWLLTEWQEVGSLAASLLRFGG